MSRDDSLYWADCTYHLNTERRYALPLSTVTEQRSWQDNITNTIRRDIRKLVCEEKALIEGVRVQRSAAFSKQTYFVGRDKTLYTLEQAVERVVVVIQDRERRIK